MSDEEYKPNSIDAVLSRMEARQQANGEKLDKALLELVEVKTRLTVLEDFKKTLMIYGGIASVGVSLMFNAVIAWWKRNN